MTNETNDALKTLVTKRGIIKGSVTRIKTFVDKFRAGDDIYQLKTRLPNLQNAFKEFDAIQRDIELLKCDTEEQTSERDEFENRYYDLEARILKLIESRVTEPIPSTSSTNNDNNQARLNPVRLPSLELPIFSGSYLEWTAFSDIFKSLIHDSRLDSDVEKLHYLKSCLKGDAHKTIEAIKVSEANYKSAWDLLEKRFNNKRLIVQEHVLAIINSPNLVKNSAVAMRKLLDDILTNIAELKNVGIQVQQWDALIVPLITLKFDFITKRDWECTLDTSVPTLEELITFLTKKTTLLESLTAGESLMQNIQCIQI
ncbi:uncharacterized protein LOC135120642 [Zophobas morio]|uniref:uncharacterized protein LOC135120642 n=1 Tax=Zophobas morio TaxID=2755281 RepID=UPI00308286DE